MAVKAVKYISRVQIPRDGTDIRDRQKLGPMVLGAAVIMLAAQLALVVHPVDHSAQQNEVACTVCSIDNVAKSLPPLTFPTLPQLETCARSARTCVEPRHSAHVSADRIRGPPVIL